MAVTSSLKTILEGAIDYAGVFPPASASVATAMREFAGYLTGPRAWALGRLVVPVSAFEELNFHIAEFETGEDAPRLNLRLSAILGDDAEACLERVRDFNRWHSGRDGKVKAVVETVEVKAAFSETISRIAEASGNPSAIFFEIPIERDPADLVSSVARVGGAVKVRTGGASTRAFPRADSLVRFLQVCLEAGLRFKATGGLRHAMTGSRALPPGAGAPPKRPGAMMFGFLNLLLCAAFMYDGLEPGQAVGILTEESPGAFTCDDAGVGWRDRRIDVGSLVGCRRDFAVSFGSASFEEPLDRLRELKLT